MKTTILVAGATGHLGALVVENLIKHDATVHALVRTGTEDSKIKKLESSGVKVIQLNMEDVTALTEASRGVSCIVSTLQGLRDVIVDLQLRLLEAAIAAGVPRFIPSDYSSDFTRLTPGDNRNFDLRREFYELIDKSPVKATSIFNGAFAEVLTYNIPLLDFKKKEVGYWEDADWKIDFTTMKNTAEYTAAAALDDSSPRDLKIAGFQVSPRELVAVAGEALATNFALTRLGSLDDLAGYNKHERAAHPEGENDVYPDWQRSQYVQSMFSVHHDSLDNDRYPGIKWTGAAEVTASSKRGG